MKPSIPIAWPAGGIGRSSFKDEAWIGQQIGTHMKVRCFACLTGLCLASVTLPVQATDLMKVYYQALHSDPTFKRAEADWQSAKENLPIARSNLLPQFNVSGEFGRQNERITPSILRLANGTNTNYTYRLTLTQPLFNFADWKLVKSARASVKAALATYAAAEQDLMLRTATAYFSVLQAYDQLRYTLARKRAVYEQLKMAQERFKVGLIAITGVYNARSDYDQTAATAIGYQNRLNDAVERLREITGRHYMWMQAITQKIPLVTPMPNNINRWVRVAEHQNYSLRAQDFSVISARETIKQQAAGWMPQINFVGSYEQDVDTALDTLPDTKLETATADLTLNFPIIQGGLVSAQTRQARYNYLSASSQLQFVHRQVVSETRQSFLGVITGISKVKADFQATKSAQNALEATKAGREVGTRTMVNVLEDLTTVYLAQQRYTDDQYRYIIDTIELKADAGTLKVSDLATINNWLKRRVKLNLPKAAFGPKLQPVVKRRALSAVWKMSSLVGRAGSEYFEKEKTALRKPKLRRNKKWLSKFKRRNRRVMKKSTVKKLVQHKLALPKSTGLSRYIVSQQKVSKKEPLLLPSSKKRMALMQLPAPKKMIMPVKKVVPPIAKKAIPRPKRTAPILMQLPTPKKMVVAVKKVVPPVAKKVIPLEDQVIPLYEKQVSSGAPLPTPS